jgi:hypothetical protein
LPDHHTRTSIVKLDWKALPLAALF